MGGVVEIQQSNCGVSGDRNLRVKKRQEEGPFAQTCTKTRTGGHLSRRQTLSQQESLKLARHRKRGFLSAAPNEFREPSANEVALLSPTMKTDTSAISPLPPRWKSN